MFFIFFFKQKTAYEMRISDWSSDVCSSDLPERRQDVGRQVQLDRAVVELDVELALRRLPGEGRGDFGGHGFGTQPVAGAGQHEIGRASCRERVCQYV